ncbi:MAG: M24 family metallopeptidase [Caldilineaceae bacterium]|nr:M24 family metallopeptidase [Caldilineaceae bacterium]
MTDLPFLQTYLDQAQVDGWLLYGFRDQNPIALRVAGLQSAGSRRWFLWIPRVGRPAWIAQTIERTTFLDLPPELHGDLHLYVTWQQMADVLRDVVQVNGQPARRILMEYSPQNAIPYVSRVDAGMMEVVQQATGAEILSSADAVQWAVARMSDQQLADHRRAVAVCLAAKDHAYDWIAGKLRNGERVTEYDAQQVVIDYFDANGLAPLPCIVAVNGNAADPHYFPSAKQCSPIAIGDVVLIDLWSRPKDAPDACMADLTWTAYCGPQTPAKVTEIFEIVRAGRDRAVHFIQERLDAGQAVHGYEVDDACRTVIEQAGYTRGILHRTGHSLGPTGHWIGVNIDNVETQDRRTLVPGVMFTIEPGIYLPDFNFDDSPQPKGLGIRSEINCYMHEDRVEVTTLPLQTTVKALLA